MDEDNKELEPRPDPNPNTLRTISAIFSIIFTVGYFALFFLLIFAPQNVEKPSTVIIPIIIAFIAMVLMHIAIRSLFRAVSFLLDKNSEIEPNLDNCYSIMKVRQSELLNKISDLQKQLDELKNPKTED